MAKRNSKLYRKICFKFHKHRCVCCTERFIITVHHLDGDRTNNHPSNLIPLCPTCHAYLHSKLKNRKMGKIVVYIMRFIEKHKHRQVEWQILYGRKEDEEKQ